MTKDLQLRITPRDAYNEQSIRRYVAREQGWDERTITCVRTLKRSIDARQRDIYVNLTVRVFINEQPPTDVFVPVEYHDVSERPQVIVVGAGPGGLFAALHLIELGLRPIVVERGKNVRDRKKDLARIRPEQRVNPESNYAFGEGGAGAYSDGKLFTRSKKRGDGEKILRVFCQHGASPSILSDAHPHIGTDRLPRVIENMRETILRCGGEVHFETRMEAPLLSPHEGGRCCVGIVCNNGREFHGPVILATGHSARDVYRWLHDNGIEIEAKGLAVGVRLEHPAQLIDQIQYHNKRGRGDYLPAAEYSLVQQINGRGVYSFCMCPGGFVVPAASGPEQIVVNGMSPSGRNGRWSNSGMVVEVRPEDLQYAETKNEGLEGSALQMMHYQEELERTCWQQGNMRQTAPAQRMADFVNNRLSYDLPDSSYAPGLISSPLHFWLPEPIRLRLQEAFKAWGRQKHGFLTNEATVIGVETRTSSPVRIVRNPETLQQTSLPGLFPCGEGAGYAGGIVSAAIDGERCAEAVAAFMGKA
ncbi:MAG: FAD-binding protein [Bacteroidaceae bacterium]|nr:FAD-binding protein [Bacteroidaceae bacterium]MBR1788829.1 FAD-binding protein [Bacteroidaceae bacterium]